MLRSSSSSTSRTRPSQKVACERNQQAVRGDEDGSLCRAERDAEGHRLRRAVRCEPRGAQPLTCRGSRWISARFV
eukprot:6375212-Prymnesium_polylepis.1